MHHQPQDQERAINLSILFVSGPGEFPRVDFNLAIVLPPEPRLKDFSLGANAVISIKPALIPSRHRLLSRLQRYLISILGRCFRSSPSSVNPRISPLATEYECPQLPLFIITASPRQPTKQRRCPILLFHANRSKPTRRTEATSAPTKRRGPARPSRSSTTSFLTATTLIYAIGAGITAAAGTRLALQLILTQKSPTLLFIVTISPNRDGIICAPAALLRSEGRFSGPLSGTKPLFPVTRRHHGKPLPYHRKPCDSTSYHDSPSAAKRSVDFVSNKYTPSVASRGFSACISSRITTVIHVARNHQINYN
ncbi:hypothetical protein L969DRAFT_48272 [Mixia osmundae IAM 14324]|uniref:Uncharacterized protein n=1 Tax=Mixia osmundae (strain CBS 9802 / IAM 14324 / JCM 22182 / KY 12970) TaxID=764103 RepID=G7E0L8_MIXOS|nr:hypothetical protein L969DRAFT_55155 [Mixia osmundae IAM 14324]KEI37813.1 hypothetical protein L969DRAFT_52825 [Mixia osmundae IAM 14324]KEI39784.1 hypothetical protein L969DRAFT_47457 [Mixia osmundae IAM 14324]KEI40302.1 hypothetical protein L969DRAFT_48272 [Mixia osmundae IAM 14324]GAA96378.1 hypothetical protein E5Q_03044 [Mixia osmundae IAM 14324]